MADVLSRPSSTSRFNNYASTSISQQHDPHVTGDWDYTSRDHTHSYATYALHTTAPKRLPMLNPDLFMVSGQNNTDSQAGMLSWMHSMSSKQIAHHRQQLKFHQRELEYWQDLALMALDLFRSKGTQEDYSILTERTYASLRGAQQTERSTSRDRDESMGDDGIPQPISHLTLDRPPLVRPSGSRFRSRRVPQKAAARRTKQFLKDFAKRIQEIFKGINLNFSSPPSSSSNANASFHPPSATLPPKRSSSPSRTSSRPSSPTQTTTRQSSHQYQPSTSSITMNPAFDNNSPGYSPGHSFSSTTSLKQMPAKKQPPPLASSTSSFTSPPSSTSASASNSAESSPAIPRKPLNLRLAGVSNADQDQPSPTSASGLYKISEERLASNSISRLSTSALLSPAVQAVSSNNNTVVELPKPKNPNSAGFHHAVVSGLQQVQATPGPPQLPAQRPSQHQRDSLVQIRQSQSSATSTQPRVGLRSAQYPSASQSARLSRAAVDAAIQGGSIKSPRSQSTSSTTPTMGTAKALHNYVESSHGAEYLSFNAGDVVLIVDDGSAVPGGGGGWWLVDLMGAIGYVPSNFFSRIESNT